MNRTQLLDLLRLTAHSFGYTFSTLSDLPLSASYEPFPLFVLRSLRSSGASGGSLAMATYRLEFSLLNLLPRGSTAESPELAVLERDGRDFLHRLAHNDLVLSADVVSLLPSSAPLSHAGDVNIAISADITVFLP